jgi:hypothetical protein
MARPGGLGLQPVRLVKRDSEHDASARAALRILYRDFLAAGELDIARASRCPGCSPKLSGEGENR